MKELKDCEVVIKFLDLSKDQLEHLFKAEDELEKAGVLFDTGAGGGCRDWEFDWSLRGAVVKFKRIKEGSK